MSIVFLPSKRPALLTPGSIQELLLVASVGIASRLHDRGHATLLGTIDAALGGIREGASGYMQKGRSAGDIGVAG